MKLFTPTDGPYWLKRFADSILAAFKQVMDAPFRLWASDAAALPPPGDYAGGLVWTKDDANVACSDGTAWQTLARADNPVLNGIVTAAPLSLANGYFWATGNADSGSGVGSFLCYDDPIGGRLGALDWTGTGTGIARKPFGIHGSSITLDIGSGDTTAAVVSVDASGATIAGRGEATHLRATGLSAPSSGSGVELAYDAAGPEGIVIAFDRSASSYRKLRLDGSSIAFNISGSTAATMTGGGLLLGNSTSAPSPSPMTVDLGGTYSNAAGTNLKLKLYNDGTNLYGLGVSANQLDYACPSVAGHNFYFGGFKGAQLTQISGRAGGSLSLNGQSPAINLADTGMGACFICTDLNKNATALLGGYMVLGVPAAKGISLAIGNTAVLDATGSGIAINGPLTLSTPLAVAQGGTGDTGTAWASFSPTWTNLTIGNGAVVARYKQIGKLVWVRVRIVLGSTSSVTGGITLTRPVNMVSYGGSVATPQGCARFFDTSAGATFEGIVSWAPGTVATIIPVVLSVSGASIVVTGTSATAPFTWAAGDELMLQYYYEAA